MTKVNEKFLEELKKEFNGCPLFEGREKGDIEIHVNKPCTITDYFKMKESSGSYYYAFTIEQDKEHTFLSGGAITKLIDKCIDNEFDPVGITFVPKEKIKTTSKRDYRPIEVL